MRSLLEFREKLKIIYGRNEIFIIPILKFLLAFLAINMVNGTLGYMTRVDDLGIVLIVSLLCSFLPTTCIVLFSAVFSLLHMYTLSVEVALVGLCVYLILFLLFFRFDAKDSLVVLFMAILCAWKMPFIVPIAVGLAATPAAVISIACGLIVYNLINQVAVNAGTINAMGSDESTAKLRLLVDGLLGNKEMMVMIVAFALTVVIVYTIRRMSVEYAWTIAMVSGAIINLIVMLLGDLMYDTNMSLVSAIIDSVLALAFAKVLEFFRFCVDYSRTEKVQFEDDEYYYYVKAVPKMTVAMEAKTVKKINSQAVRSVTTERTGVRKRSGGPQRSYYNERAAKNGRSVTIGNAGEEEVEDLD